MANKDYERMVELGKWLEKYLDPDIKPDEYKKLAEDAIRLYNFDFQITKNDISLVAIDYLYRLPLEIQNILCNFEKRELFIEQINDLDSFINPTDVYTLQDGQEVVSIPAGIRVRNGDIYSGYFTDFDKTHKNFVNKIEALDIPAIDKAAMLCLMELTKRLSQLPLRRETCIEDEIYRAFIFSEFKKTTMDILQNIYSSNRPWHEFFYNKLKKEFKPYGDIDAAKLIYWNYKNVVKGIIFKEDGPVEMHSQSFVTGKSKHSAISVPWEAFSSKIVLDFLLLGGQDYFLFCEYCGKFTVIQRKGRKKYCSDICRVSHRNAELAKR